MSDNMLTNLSKAFKSDREFSDDDLQSLIKMCCDCGFVTKTKGLFFKKEYYYYCPLCDDFLEPARKIFQKYDIEMHQHESSRNGVFKQKVLRVDILNITCQSERMLHALTAARLRFFVSKTRQINNIKSR